MIELILEGYTNSNMTGYLDGRKSTLGYVFTFAGIAMSLHSKLRKCLVLSIIKAKYIAIVEAGNEMLWMKQFLQELGLKQKEYAMFCNSQSVINLSKNSGNHAGMQ